MKTYNSIIENIIKTKNNIFLPTEPNDVDCKYKILFEIFLKKEYSVKNKFLFFDETLHNFWIKHDKKDVDQFINCL